MEIKKTAKGWEYDGVVFVDERSALGVKESTEKAASTSYLPQQNQAIEVIYDGSQPTSFGLFITKFLKTSDLGMVKLAKEIGVSRQALFDWMNSKSIPSRKHVEAIIKVTRCRPGELREALQDNFEMQKTKLFENIRGA